MLAVLYQLLKLIEGGFWDFTADLTFKDTAYTNEFLGAHTDNTYFTDPARLQLFHLLSHTDGAGGASLLVDGFAVARQLFKENQHHYRALVKERHPWHASGNENACIQPSVRAPVLSLHQDMGTVYQLRSNNYDRAPKCDWRLGAQRLWYEAAFHFNAILNQEKRQIWTQLEPGTALSKYITTISENVTEILTAQSLTIGECCTGAQSSQGRGGCVAATVRLLSPHGGSTQTSDSV